MLARVGVEVVCVGLIVGQLLAASDPLAVPVIVGGATALLAAPRPAMAPIAAAAMGTAAIGWAEVRQLERVPLPACHVARMPLPERVVLHGVVAAPVERYAGRGAVLVRARAATSHGDRRVVCGLVRVRTGTDAPELALGDHVRVHATLREVRGFVNPGLPDWSVAQRRKGIHVTASIREARALERVGRGAGWRARVDRWRERVARRITVARAGDDGAILRALVVGDEQFIGTGLRERFARAGVVHVLSVSGLHVSLVAVAALTLFRRCLVLHRALAVRGYADTVARVLAVLPVGLYVLLAGARVATVRAAAMVLVATGAAVGGRAVGPGRALALAAAMLAVARPGAPADVAYQLSVASVLAIVTVVSDPARGRARAAIRLAILLWGLTAPLTARHFQQVSLVAPLANLVLVPLFGSLVVAMGLAGALLEPAMPCIATTLFRVAAGAIAPGRALIEWAGTQPWAARDVPTPSAPELALLVAAVVARQVLSGRRRAVVLGCVALGLGGDMAWWGHERFGRPTTRVTFLDVGQGDAAVLEEKGGRVVVVDAGGFPGSDFDTGAAIVGPYLRSRRIGRIDVLVVSHAHPDHMGGVPTLVRRFRPRELWWAGEPGGGRAWADLMQAVAEVGVRTRRLHAGDEPLPGLRVLHPPVSWLSRSRNDASLVVGVETPAGHVVFMGDVERAGELVLTERGLPRAVVVKVPHHGSQTSSSRGVVAATAPVLAVVSVGAGNSYRQPASEVTARWRAGGACVMRTDLCGAVSVELGAQGISVRGARRVCACAPRGSLGGDSAPAMAAPRQDLDTPSHVP